MTHTRTGGCQCGAVRFKVTGALRSAGFCHCRMCQKAFGSPGAALVSVPADRVVWTRGTPAAFRSSAVVTRTFCAHCGTPLSLREDDDPTIELAIAAFDDAQAIAPTHQVGIESRLSWFADIASLPERTTSDDRTPDDLARIVSHQHPDHDTDVWPPDQANEAPLTT